MVRKWGFVGEFLTGSISSRYLWCRSALNQANNEMRNTFSMFQLQRHLRSIVYDAYWFTSTLTPSSAV